MKRLLELGADISLRETAGFSALDVVCCDLDTAALSLFVAHNVDLNAKDDIGETQLMMIDFEKDGAYAFASQLIASGADINAKYLWKNPLTKAVSDGSKALVTFLLSHGAATDIRDLDGRTALRRADSADIALLLLEHGANVDLPCWKGYTPLIAALDRNDIETVQLLLAFNASVHAQAAGETPIFYAKTEEAVNMLHAHGADLNHINDKGGNGVNQRVEIPLNGRFFSLNSTWK